MTNYFERGERFEDFETTLLRNQFERLSKEKQREILNESLDTIKKLAVEKYNITI